MATDLDIPLLERPEFFDGQRLAAGDLRAVHQYHEQLRWLHNRALHNWGIAAGYEVTGLRGEKVVRVRGGYALDCRGREILLAAEQQMAVPAVAGPAGFYLTAAYEPDEAIEPQTRGGPCGASGAVRRADRPRLR